MSEPDKNKVAILHQGCVPVYRRAFFERLGACNGAHYHVFYGKPPSNTSLQAAPGPFSFASTKVRNLELKLGNSVIVYQPVVLRYLFGGYRAAVIGHEFKFLSSLLILILSRLLGRPVIWWGFGYRKAYGAWRQQGRPGLKDRLAMWAADRLARMGNGYLAYTEAGKVHLTGIGFPPERIQVLRNTIDIEEQIALAQTASSVPAADIRAGLGLAPDSHVLAFIGRLVPRKKADLLIRFALQTPQIDGRKVEVLIIGDGEQRRQLESLAQGKGNIHFTGALDPADPAIARALRVSSAVVIPGYLGLAINHAFAHGRPVITQDHDYHSPEIDYLSNKVDGLLLSRDDDVFCAELADFLRDPDLQQRLSENARETRESLRMDHMVRNFDGFVSGFLPQERSAND